MLRSRLDKGKMWRVAREVALCGAPVAGAGGNGGFAESSLGELFPLALVVAAFAGAGAWMFRRFRTSPSTGVTEEGASGVAPAPAARHATLSAREPAGASPRPLSA